MRRTWIAGILITVGCRDAVAECANLCKAINRCGLLPSELAANADDAQMQRNCAARCDFSDAAFREELLALCEDPVEQVLGVVPGDEWCPTVEDGRCFALTECLAGAFGPVPPLGEIRPRVALVASESAAAECLDGPCQAEAGTCSSGSNALPCLAGSESKCALPTSLLDPAGSFAAEAGVSSIRARLHTSDGDAGWETVRISALRSGAFVSQAAGSLQAEVEIRGTYPPSISVAGSSEETATVSDATNLELGEGGLNGDYCWRFWSDRTTLRSTSTADMQVRIPPTGATAIARAYLQADSSAKGFTTLNLCETSVTSCRNGWDDDGDGMVDCDDPECAPYCSTEEMSAETCGSGVDDDGDGYVDCIDPGCSAFCEQSESECRNGIDDDGDRETDCRDPGCAWLCDRRGESSIERDDDTNVELPCPTLAGGAPDCSNKSCAWTCGIEWPDQCSNGRDDDGDGLSDSADPDCVRSETGVLQCADGIENDCSSATCPRHRTAAACQGDVRCRWIGESSACEPDGDCKATGTDCEDPKCAEYCTKGDIK